MCLAFECRSVLRVSDPEKVACLPSRRLHKKLTTCLVRTGLQDDAHVSDASRYPAKKPYRWSSQHVNFEPYCSLRYYHFLRLTQYPFNNSMISLACLWPTMGMRSVDSGRSGPQATGEWCVWHKGEPSAVEGRRVMIGDFAGSSYAGGPYQPGVFPTRSRAARIAPAANAPRLSAR